MKFNLDRDLCFFDVESTGLNVIRDRIVQIAIIKYPKNGEDPLEFVELINPGIPISPEAMSVHGLTPDILRNKPTFQQIGKQIFDFIGNSDLAGYNSNRFDVPILMEEFARIGLELDMSKRRTIDVQRIFYKMEPRTLSAAYKYYTGNKMQNAHDALEDVRATIDVLKGQLEMYKDTDIEDQDGTILEKPVKNDMKVLHDFTTDSNMIDATMRLKYNHEGVIVFNFGKYNGQPVAKVLAEDKQYYNWMLNKEFSSQVKQLIKKIVKEHYKHNS